MKNIQLALPLKVIRADQTSTLEERVNTYIAEQKEIHGRIYADIDFKVDDGMMYAFIMITPVSAVEEQEHGEGCTCGNCC